MTPERFAEIELYTKHLTASGQLVGGCLRECLEEIARLRADASTASPSCDRCQSAHCCSVTGSTVPPLCVTDPEGSLPLWMPWTNADVQARVDPLHAEIDRLRAEAGRVVVPECSASPNAGDRDSLTTPHVADGTRPTERGRSLGERMSAKCEEICEMCDHSLVGNDHGFDQNDADINENGDLVHSGKCTYCSECRETP